MSGVNPRNGEGRETLRISGDFPVVHFGEVEPANKGPDFFRRERLLNFIKNNCRARMGTGIENGEPFICSENETLLVIKIIRNAFAVFFPVKFRKGADGIQAQRRMRDKEHAFRYPREFCDGNEPCPIGRERARFDADEMPRIAVTAETVFRAGTAQVKGCRFIHSEKMREAIPVIVMRMGKHRRPHGAKIDAEFFRIFKKRAGLAGIQ